jgi:hypothetical protein
MGLWLITDNYGGIEKQLSLRDFFKSHLRDSLRIPSAQEISTIFYLRVSRRTHLQVSFLALDGAGPWRGGAMAGRGHGLEGHGESPTVGYAARATTNLG